MGQKFELVFTEKCLETIVSTIYIRDEYFYIHEKLKIFKRNPKKVKVHNDSAIILFLLFHCFKGKDIPL